MYCKNCGKKLPDNARFCDRCNTSVRKKNDKKELIEELKEERLARRKAQAVEERLKKIQTKHKEKRKKALLIAVAAIVVGIVSGIGAYMVFISTSQFGEGDMYVDVYNSPKATFSASERVSSEPADTTDATATESADLIDASYVEMNIESITFVYPKGFEKQNTEDEKVLYSFEDVQGDAVISVYKDTSQTNAKEIMKTYADRMGGTVIKSLAADDWYSITISRDLKTYHRKGVVTDSTVIYYEMIYPAATSKEGQYTENIEYMDKYFTGE